MSALIVWLWTTMAWGALVPAEYCVDYVGLDYTDRQTGDLLTLTSIPARGVRIRFEASNGQNQAFYADWSGSDKGCITVQLEDTLTYDIKVLRKASVDGNIIEVRTSPTGALYATTVATGWSHQFATSTTFDVGVTDSVRILAAASRSLARRSGGITDTFVFVDDDCPTSSGASCNDWPTALYINPAHADYKFLIAHELGHALFQVADGGLETAADTSANMNDCSTSSSYNQSAHKLTSKEFQSNAAIEGAANFYSAIAFNRDVVELDCDFEVHYDVDWDADGLDDLGLKTTSCEGGHTSMGVDAFDYLGDYCTGSGFAVNRATEYDWLRQLWDFHTDDGVSFATILDIWDEADPNDWQTNGTIQTSDAPPVRFSDAVLTIVDAATQADWDSSASVNGVDR